MDLSPQSAEIMARLAKLNVPTTVRTTRGARTARPRRNRGELTQRQVQKYGRRKMSVYQAVSLASGRGVLPDRDIELYRDPQNEPGLREARSYWIVNGQKYLNDPVRWWS